MNVTYAECTQNSRTTIIPTNAALPKPVRLRRRQYQFRVWWVRDYGVIHAADKTSPGPMRPGNVLKYILTRKTWNPTGWMKEWLCVKKGL